ncbi:hypothetical protein ASD14_06510 [Lysobacter sp. Root494]|nr:hypothetical protein ASD14_06510 [Lysobacter sp. Root494]
MDVGLDEDVHLAIAELFEDEAVAAEVCRRRKNCHVQLWPARIDHKIAYHMTCRHRCRRLSLRCS